MSVALLISLFHSLIQKKKKYQILKNTAENGTSTLAIRRILLPLNKGLRVK